MITRGNVMLMQKILEVGESDETLADFLGMRTVTFWKKCMGLEGAEFNYRQIQALRGRLGLTAGEAALIFLR